MMKSHQTPEQISSVFEALVGQPIVQHLRTAEKGDNNNAVNNQLLTLSGLSIDQVLNNASRIIRPLEEFNLACVVSRDLGPLITSKQEADTIDHRPFFRDTEVHDSPTPLHSVALLPGGSVVLSLGQKELNYGREKPSFTASSSFSPHHFIWPPEALLLTDDEDFMNIKIEIDRSPELTFDQLRVALFAVLATELDNNSSLDS